MAIPLTGLVKVPFSIRKPAAPTEKSPEIGLAVCIPITEVTKDGDGSWVFAGETKGMLTADDPPDAPGEAGKR